MRALTIRQPWADAIAHGEKRIENRTWATRHRGDFLIHAAAAEDRNALPAEMTEAWPDTRSGVIAVAGLVEVHFANGRCCQKWGFPEVYHWELANVRRLAEPVPCKGRLGLWTPSQDIVTAVLEQERETVR